MIPGGLLTSPVTLEWDTQQFGLPVAQIVDPDLDVAALEGSLPGPALDSRSTPGSPGIDSRDFTGPGFSVAFVGSWLTSFSSPRPSRIQPPWWAWPRSVGPGMWDRSASSPSVMTFEEWGSAR